MEKDAKYRMSAARLKELMEERDYLRTTRENEVANQIKEARSFGDLSENSEYDEAKTEQAKLYVRLEELEDLNSRIIAQGNTPELLKEVNHKYSELWMFNVMFTVGSLSSVIGGLMDYPGYGE